MMNFDLNVMGNQINAKAALVPSPVLPIQIREINSRNKPNLSYFYTIASDSVLGATS